MGFLVLQDPPKDRHPGAIDDLAELGIALKMITGDNRRVAASVARRSACRSSGILTGADLDNMSDEALWSGGGSTPTVFAEVEPNQKERIILSPAKRRAMSSAIWATGSTTPRPCARRTSAFPLNRRSMSPRKRPISF